MKFASWLLIAVIECVMYAILALSFYIHWIFGLGVLCAICIPISVAAYVVIKYLRS